MDDERQQRLEAHVAPGGQGVAGVRDALDVEPPEAPLCGPLLHDGDRHAVALLVEDQGAASACGGEQVREAIGRRGHGGDRGRDDDRRRCHPGRAPPGTAPHRRPGAEQGGRHREHSQRGDDAEPRDEQKTGEERARDAADRVQGQRPPEIASDVTGIHDQPHGGGEGGAEQQRRDEHECQGRDHEAGAHFDHAARRGEEGLARGGGLERRQPSAEQRHLEERDEAGGADEQSEDGPWIAHAIGPRGVQRGAEGEARQVGREHQREGDAAGAHELHRDLRPDHLVAEREGTGDRIEEDRRSGRAGRWGRAGCRRRRVRGRSAPIDPGCAGRRNGTERRRGECGAADAERRDEHERHRECAGDGTGGVGRIHATAAGGDAVGL